jgi:hypothetical protein
MGRARLDTSINSFTAAFRDLSSRVLSASISRILVPRGLHPPTFFHLQSWKPCCFQIRAVSAALQSYITIAVPKSGEPKWAVFRGLLGSSSNEVGPRERMGEVTDNQDHGCLRRSLATYNSKPMPTSQGKFSRTDEQYHQCDQRVLPNHHWYLTPISQCLLPHSFASLAVRVFKRKTADRITTSS